MAPRWVGPVLGACLVVEFVGSAVIAWSSELAVGLYLAALTALAASMWRSPRAAWCWGGDNRPAGPDVAAPATS